MTSTEIIVDNFAGGGGASTGIRIATGRDVDEAINHDPIAIAMHMANHPNTHHWCEDVWAVDPRKVANGRPVALCWLSPDCKHFSKAKGGKPVDKSIRGLAWVAVRWAATVKPRVIILENVEEFQTWGPLLESGHPDPKQKGRTFRSFVHALERQGYTVDWRELRASDYGAPTIRKRLFLVARCDGRPINWPEPTHGDPSGDGVRSGRLLPWRTAAEIIDWSLPCPSIFGRERPLAEATMRRIARGVMRFVIDNPAPFVIKVNHGGDVFRGQRIDEPMQTITAKNGWGVVAPVIGRQFGASVGHSIANPLGTITAGGGGKSQLVTAFLSKYHGAKSDETRGQTMQMPLLTQDTSNRFALVTSHLVKMYGTTTGQAVTEPVHTITSGGQHLGEVRAFLIKYYGCGEGQSCSDPLHTVTARDRFGLVAVEGEDYQVVDIGMRMLEPRELFNAQGFPADYIINVGADGKRLSKAAQVARCGNAVPPPFAEALVRANLPEMCERKAA
jgi:DNA (cytosine-5)-methyltransferase 1